MSSQSVDMPLINRSFYKKLVLFGAAFALLMYLFIGWSTSFAIGAVDRGFFDYFSTVTLRSWALDTLISEILITNTARLLPLLFIVVWLLLDHIRRGKSVAFFGYLLAGSFAAMTASRVMQNLSPYRPRPLHNPDIDYQLPFGIQESTLEGWSSFPSDTSALAFSIVAGIFLASRRLGILALIWGIVVVAFPRAYAGLHYPSDLLGGALIGLLCTSAMPAVTSVIGRNVNISLHEKWYPILWAAAFLYLFQVGTMFNDLRVYGYFVQAVLGF